MVANTAARSCAVCCRNRRKRSSDCGNAFAEAPPLRSQGCCSICSTVRRCSGLDFSSPFSSCFACGRSVRSVGSYVCSVGRSMRSVGRDVGAVGEAALKKGGIPQICVLHHCRYTVPLPRRRRPSTRNGYTGRYADVTRTLHGAVTSSETSLHAGSSKSYVLRQMRFCITSSLASPYGSKGW